METYGDQEERVRTENERRVEEKADAIRSRNMNKICIKCSCHFLAPNNIHYNEVSREWEHRDCTLVVITKPITVGRLRDAIQQSFPKNTSRMMAPSSGRKPGFYLIRVEKQKAIDVTLHSLADLNDDFVVKDSLLSSDATPK